MWKSIVVLAFYHHDVISGTKCKTTIIPHIVPHKKSMPHKEALIADQ